MATVSAGEDVKQVHREPHPFVSKDNISTFVGKTIAFVGRVDRVEDTTLIMKTEDSKFISLFQYSNHNYPLQTAKSESSNSEEMPRNSRVDQ